MLTFTTELRMSRSTIYLFLRILMQNGKTAFDVTSADAEKYKGKTKYRYYIDIFIANKNF